MMYQIKKSLLTLIVTFGLVTGMQFGSGAIVQAGLFDGARDQACKGTELQAGSGTASNCRPGEEANLNNTIKTVINILSIVVGIVAVIMIIVNGFRFVVSRGESSAVASARNGIIYAIVGLVFVALAQFIVKFVIDQAG